MLDGLVGAACQSRPLPSTLPVTTVLPSGLKVAGPDRAVMRQQKPHGLAG